MILIFNLTNAFNQFRTMQFRINKIMEGFEEQVKKVFWGMNNS
jgi:hypothetical protein